MTTSYWLMLFPRDLFFMVIPFPTTTQVLHFELRIDPKQSVIILVCTKSSINITFLEAPHFKKMQKVCIYIWWQDLTPVATIPAYSWRLWGLLLVWPFLLGLLPSLTPVGTAVTRLLQNPVSKLGGDLLLAQCQSENSCDFFFFALLALNCEGLSVASFLPTQRLLVRVLAWFLHGARVSTRFKKEWNGKSYVCGSESKGMYVFCFFWIYLDHFRIWSF